VLQHLDDNGDARCGGRLDGEDVTGGHGRTDVSPALYCWIPRGAVFLRRCEVSATVCVCPCRGQYVGISRQQCWVDFATARQSAVRAKPVAT